MTEKTLPVRGKVSFEEMKRVNDHGAEYWSARDLQPLLGYLLYPHDNHGEVGTII